VLSLTIDQYLKLLQPEACHLLAVTAHSLSSHEGQRETDGLQFEHLKVEILACLLRPWFRSDVRVLYQDTGAFVSKQTEHRVPVRLLWLQSVPGLSFKLNQFINCEQEVLVRLDGQSLQKHREVFDEEHAMSWFTESISAWPTRSTSGTYIGHSAR
jgi:hypothetical protein